MDVEKKNTELIKDKNFGTFDYSKVAGIPELTIKIEFLNRMMDRFATKGRRVLEIGMGAGETTEFLLKKFDDIVVVDVSDSGYKSFIAKQDPLRLKNLTFIHSSIENADLSGKQFDNILMSCVIEHLEFPVEVLNELSKSLTEKGVIHLVIALSNSMHRLVGVKEGVIENPELLGPTDIELGHYRMYTPQLLNDQISKAGLIKSFEKSFYLKPLPYSMLSKVPLETHLALSSLGEDYPELACYLYVEVTRGES